MILSAPYPTVFEYLIMMPKGQVLCLSRLEETVNDAQLVIECVLEDFDVKAVLFEKISNLNFNNY